MSNVLRKLYERIFPASKRQVRDNIEDVKRQIADLKKSEDKNQKEIIQFLKNQAARQTKNQESNERTGTERFAYLQQEFMDQKKKIEQLNLDNQAIKSQLKQLDLYTKKAQRASDEAVWGLVFEDTIRDSEWLTNATFTPGRWAAGYQLLYVLYRILGEAKPKSILELGLGQTTRMISQYAGSHKDVKHRVVEHDPEWIRFFANEFELPENTEVVQLQLDKIKYLDDDAVIAYKDFESNLQDRKYDMISIDAPFGGMAIKYSRVDTLQLLPQCLAESFVITIDDTNRQAELNTVELIKSKLDESSIKYVVGKYSGNKDCHVITSEDKRFLCSM